MCVCMYVCEREELRMNRSYGRGLVQGLEQQNGESDINCICEQK